MTDLDDFLDSEILESHKRKKLPNISLVKVLWQELS